MSSVFVPINSVYPYHWYAPETERVRVYDQLSIPELSQRHFATSLSGDRLVLTLTTSPGFQSVDTYQNASTGNALQNHIHLDGNDLWIYVCSCSLAFFPGL